MTENFYSPDFDKFLHSHATVATPLPPCRIPPAFLPVFPVFSSLWNVGGDSSYLYSSRFSPKYFLGEGKAHLSFFLSFAFSNLGDSFLNLGETPSPKSFLSAMAHRCDDPLLEVPILIFF